MAFHVNRVIIAASCCFAVGCGEKLHWDKVAPEIRQALEHSEQFELISLEPVSR